MKIMSSGNFKRLLVDVHTDAKTLADKVQALLDDAFNQATHPSQGGHGSTARLSMIMQMVEQNRRLPTRKIQKYIQAHAEVRWAKDKGSDSYSFSFIGGKPVVYPRQDSWFDWEGDQSHKAVPSIDIVTNIKSLLTRIETASKKGGEIKNEELIPALRKLVAEVHK